MSPGLLAASNPLVEVPSAAAPDLEEGGKGKQKGKKGRGKGAAKGGKGKGGKPGDAEDVPKVKTVQQEAKGASRPHSSYEDAGN